MTASLLGGSPTAVICTEAESQPRVLQAEQVMVMLLPTRVAKVGRNVDVKETGAVEIFPLLSGMGSSWNHC